MYNYCTVLEVDAFPDSIKLWLKNNLHVQYVYTYVYTCTAVHVHVHVQMIQINKNNKYDITHSPTVQYYAL